MILLFTDFGGDDLYVGQVKAVLALHAPQAPVVDLLHAAPAFDVSSSAHLLAALCERFAPGDVCLAVVDPGVGGVRDAVVLMADGRWFVAPDNGLLAVVAARAKQTQVWRVTWRPPTLSHSFHGRDLFAPLAAWIAAGHFPADKLAPAARLNERVDGHDLPCVIYIDHYGNGFTGLRAAGVDHASALLVAGRSVSYARTFSAAARGEAFWYENSVGLVEIAVAQGNAAQVLGLSVGDALTLRK